MQFDGFNTIEGRHLVAAYTAVFLVQAGYLLWIARQWFKLNTAAGSATRSDPPVTK